MNREQMVEMATQAVSRANGQSYVGHRNTAEVVLDAVLPQVTTVAELEALKIDPDATLVTGHGLAVRALYVDELDFEFGPLTVVWQPASVA